MKIIDFERKGNLVRFYLGKDKVSDYTGDGWRKRPYCDEAGPVSEKYISGLAEIVFPFDTLVLEPCSGDPNCAFSKEDMKLGKTPCVIAVPAHLAATSSLDSFSYWSNCKGIVKFYFGDPMELTEGIASYCFNPNAAGSTEVTTVMARAGADQNQGGNSKGKVPIWQKSNLTVEEASAYFGIGTQKIRALTDNPRCDYVLFVGSKRLIKREKFEKYLHTLYSI